MYISGNWPRSWQVPLPDSQSMNLTVTPPATTSDRHSWPLYVLTPPCTAERVQTSRRLSRSDLRGLAHFVLMRCSVGLGSCVTLLAVATAANTALTL